ncbi:MULTISPECIES: DoxX family protein [Chryseobacterium]|uniref:Membrane protein n=1 Tax=Chryseobacterium camelliae TaxID=1265445 RepID=A0ABU0TIE5_9FLAO|nr:MULTISPECIES: hypothetical protein [Chryseobacterium]MDT3409307.1 putative membrane protein [Pseudacidovorax intermedius]MDQ1096829.1 putative membrane protein [Chryseobacterium camelliae]MDQ1100770.1 putative membrane protein [Chryseobacterium sp. SORGH_AS_1048]MDR6084214.1 putative membrane protein [Chryseobacterium sp. SORGH_AS_0909]MDR6132484.1 putative membrane protein [Chryseobacterium sp. SORGH_AS_1175]
MNTNTLKNIGKYALGGMLITAGIGHLTFARKAFRAQVPEWVPLEKDDTVFYSGIAEIALGASIIGASEEQQKLIGKVAAGFFTAIFPGNISQYVNRKDSFGLNTDQKRLGRLFMQPLLVAWALGTMQKK